MSLQTDFEEYYYMLINPLFPVKGVCQHHGVHFISGDIEVSITDRNGSMLVIISNRLWKLDYNTGRYGEEESTKRTHNRRIQQVISALERFGGEGDLHANPVKVLDRWNGENNHKSVSIVLNVDTPAGLNCAINHYRNDVGNVFEYTAEERRNSNIFRTFIDVNQPEWVNINRIKVDAKQNRIDHERNIYEKLKKLQQLGLNDIVGLVTPTIPPKLRQLLESTK